MADIALSLTPSGGSVLALHDRANGRKVTGLDLGDPEHDSQWAFSADTEGERRANTRRKNRTIVVSELLEAASASALETLDNGLSAAMGAADRDGAALKFTNSAGTDITFDVREASFTRTLDVADVARNRGRYELVFICAPLGKGAQVTGPTDSNNDDPVVVVDVEDVPGDAPAETIVVITESGSQHRRYVQWGAGPDVTNAYLIDSDDLETTGFGGTATTLTGAYDPDSAGNSVIGTSVSAPTAMCGTGDLGHRGRYQVVARVQAADANAKVRLTWKNNDGPFTSNAWHTIIDEDTWVDANLGIVTLDTTDNGTQQWTGRVDGAAESDSSETTIYVDFIALFPIDYGYGVARAVSPDVAGVLVAHDSFTGTTATNALDGRTASAGGDWATSGATTDFAFSDDAKGSSDSENIKRGTTADTGGRLAVLGATDYSDVTVETLFTIDNVNGSAGTNVTAGVIGRWTDANNYLRATFSMGSGGQPTVALTITQVVSGSETVVASTSDWPASTSAPGFAIVSNWFRVVLTVYASGRASAQVLATGVSDTFQTTQPAGTVMLACSGISSDLATSGTLEDGLPGIYDEYDGSTSSLDRYYDSFRVYEPAGEDITLYSGQTFRVESHGRVEREDSGGTTYGEPSSWEGHRIVLRPGDNRIAFRATRLDLTTGAYDNVADELDVAVFYTPRYFAVPS